MSKPETEKILGIDLGTTNSAAAIREAGRPVIIPSAEGQTAAGRMFPSVIAFTKDGQLIVGEPANRRQATKDAGEIAGCEVARIIHEPTGACLASELEKAAKELKIMVLSFGR